MSSAPATAPARPAAPPAPPDLRFPELQGQRGVAARCSVLFDVDQYDRSSPDARSSLEGTWAHPPLLGLDGIVDRFLVLSAFLLTLPYARAQRDGSPLTSARDFLGRRAVVLAGALGRPSRSWHRVSARGVLPWLGLLSAASPCGTSRSCPTWRPTA